MDCSLVILDEDLGFRVDFRRLEMSALGEKLE